MSAKSEARGEKSRSTWFIRISLGVLLFGISLGASAQPAWRITGRSLPELRRDTLLSVPAPAAFGSLLSYPGLRASAPSEARPSSVFDRSPRRLPLTYSAADLAFFCRIELKLERAAGLPVKFRLGEVEAVERLEGKWRW